MPDDNLKNWPDFEFVILKGIGDDDHIIRTVPSVALVEAFQFGKVIRLPEAAGRPQFKVWALGGVDLGNPTAHFSQRFEVAAAYGAKVYEGPRPSVSERLDNPLV